jgi:hypothetical protein
LGLQDEVIRSCAIIVLPRHATRDTPLCIIGVIKRLLQARVQAGVVQKVQAITSAALSWSYNGTFGIEITASVGRTPDEFEMIWKEAAVA